MKHYLESGTQVIITAVSRIEENGPDGFTIDNSDLRDLDVKEALAGGEVTAFAFVEGKLTRLNADASPPEWRKVDWDDNGLYWED